MSLQSRAHALAKRLGVPYQTALQRIRSLPEKELAEVCDKGLSRRRAEELLIADFDGHVATHGRARYECWDFCEECEEPYWYSLGKKGIPASVSDERFCEKCLGTYDACPHCDALMAPGLAICTECMDYLVNKDD
ncbi:hypothetical protein OAX78_00105 [Planctomycetota bacterium]|nr:hypothetical protein [Planctomycetota bacterium]